MNERPDQFNRKIHRRSGESHSWAVSYVDLLTVLLCFFIIFFSVEKHQDKKETVFSDIVRVFHNTETPVSVTKIEQKQNQNQNQPSSENHSNDLSGATRTIHEIASTEFVKDYGSMVFVGKQLVIEIPKVSFFPSGEKNLTPEGNEVTIKMIESLLPYKNKIHLTIQGHTDSRPIRKISFEDNWELSVLRASTVLKRFIASGFPAEDASAEGFADYKVKRAISSEDEKSLSYMRKITIKIKDKSHD
jgi:chemotaxis protein MotB